MRVVDGFTDRDTALAAVRATGKVADIHRSFGGAIEIMQLFVALTKAFKEAPFMFKLERFTAAEYSFNGATLFNILGL